MEKKEVAVREQGVVSDVSPERWTMMLSQSDSIVKSGLAPKGDTKETVVIKLLAGREFGLSAMQSLRSLYVVSGKIAMMSDIAAGLVFQRLLGARIDCIDTTDKVATFRASRPGGIAVNLSFTMEDAKRAGLTTNPTWSKYPAQMLRARCQIAICRLAFPDVCAGLYTPEELGDKVLPVTGKPIAEPRALPGTVVDAEFDIGGAPEAGQAAKPEPAKTKTESADGPELTDQQRQEQILIWAQEITGATAEDSKGSEMEALFVAWGNFTPTHERGKDGKKGKEIPEDKRKVHPGRRNVFDYTGKWLKGVFDEAKKSHEEWEVIHKGAGN